MKTWEKFLELLLYIGESWWFRLAGLAIVCTFQLAHSAHEHAETATYLPLSVETEIQQHPYLDLVGDALPLPAFLIALLIEKLKKRKATIQPDAETLLAIIDQLGTTVGQKTNARHCKAAKLLKPQGADNMQQHLSTPRSQIEALVENVWQIFYAEVRRYGVKSPQQLKVTLAEMNTKQGFLQFRHFFPQNLHPESAGNLSSRKSAFATVARSGSMLVIEDIAKELASREAKYVRSESQEGNAGSIVCVPIQIQPLDGIPRIPLVLSIKCDEPKIFRNKRRARYEFLSRPFVERIRLEYYNEKINGVQHEH